MPKCRKVAECNRARIDAANQHAARHPVEHCEAEIQRAHHLNQQQSGIVGCSAVRRQHTVRKKCRHNASQKQKYSTDDH